jgi:hypothetical protein
MKAFMVGTGLCYGNDTFGRQDIEALEAFGGMGRLLFENLGPCILVMCALIPWSTSTTDRLGREHNMSVFPVEFHLSIFCCMPQRSSDCNIRNASSSGDQHALKTCSDLCDNDTKLL